MVVWWLGGFLGSRGAEEAEVASYGATQMGLSTCCAGVRREGGEAAGLRKPAVEWEMFSLSPKWPKEVETSASVEAVGPIAHPA